MYIEMLRNFFASKSTERSFYLAGVGDGVIASIVVAAVALLIVSLLT